MDFGKLTHFQIQGSFASDCLTRGSVPELWASPQVAVIGLLAIILTLILLPTPLLSSVNIDRHIEQFDIQ